MENPPTEKFEYVAPKRVGTCEKCGQGIYELTTFVEERFSRKEGIEWLRKYIMKKLRSSKVIPEDMLSSITARIVSNALRAGTHKLPDRYVPDGRGGWKLVKGRFACIDRADREVEWAIKYPPPPISRRRFSLKAFVKMETGE